MLHALRIRLVGETPLRRRLLAKRALLGEEVYEVLAAACGRRRQLGIVAVHPATERACGSSSR